ncbi:hypothetical protein LTR37_017084 [Vermiconidia calcicola]|uniref:Uncharacterized protein n=1 Tax=Vermiconidia calcicola TaxID=1690605 RepID=A0ACC3MLY5_9PEZI|nr:hypothetical protein LTR37_017084 [Vermiconidia calcicola]
MARIDHKSFAQFGYDHSRLGKVKLGQILDDLDIDHDSHASAYDLLVVVEKAYADQRVAQEGSGLYWDYLEDGFLPHSITAAKLRQILSYHKVDYHSTRATKSDLVVVFESAIDDMRDEIDYDPITNPAEESPEVEDLADGLSSLSTSDSPPPQGKKSKQAPSPKARSSPDQSREPKQITPPPPQNKERSVHKGSPANSLNLRRSPRTAGPGLSLVDIRLLGNFIESTALRDGHAQDALEELEVMIATLKSKIG